MEDGTTRNERPPRDLLVGLTLQLNCRANLHSGASVDIPKLGKGNRALAW